MRAHSLWRGVRFALLVAVVSGALLGSSCDAFDTATAPTPGLERPSPTATVRRAPTPMLTPTPSPSDLVRLNAPGAADVSGLDGQPLLHVQLIGFAGQPQAQVGMLCGPALVLNKPAASYTASEVGAIRTYFNTNFRADFYGAPKPDTKVPPSLRWVAGSTFSCYGDLEVTNTSTRLVAIERVGMVLAAEPVVNHYHYALVDVCTIAPNLGGFCEGIGGGFSPCPVEAHIHLAPRAPGSLSEAPLTQSRDDSYCPQPSPLHPGETLAIHLIVDPPASLANLIVRVTPQLTVTDVATHTIALPRLTSRLAYADLAQFSCYGSDGTRLTRLTGDILRTGYGRWCV